MKEEMKSTMLRKLQLCCVNPSSVALLDKACFLYRSPIQSSQLFLSEMELHVYTQFRRSLYTSDLDEGFAATSTDSTEFEEPLLKKGRWIIIPFE